MNKVQSGDQPFCKYMFKFCKMFLNVVINYYNFYVLFFKNSGDCNQPAFIDGSFFTPIQNSYNEGAVITYDCRTGIF